MNFLQMCQRVFTEGGVSGQIGSVQNQTGEAGRIVGWVASAYREILNDQGSTWKFLRKTAVVQLTSGKNTYSFDDLNLAEGVQWDTREMRVAINPDMSDETFLEHRDYSSFRNYWLFSSRRSVRSRPLDASVNDDTELVLAPIPASDYWLSLQYQIAPADLTQNDDIPVIPARFHMAIVWRALRHYGMFEAAPEVVSRADTGYKETMLQLEIDQTPEVCVGGALC